MFDKWRRTLNRSRLKDQAYAFLFEPPPDNQVVSLDCEMSGADVKTGEILAIAALPIAGTRIKTSERLDLLLRPTEELQPEAVAVHWLRPIDVAAGVTPDEAMATLLRFIGSRPIVGYYLDLDIALINRHLRSRLGISLPNPVIDVSRLYYDVSLPMAVDGYVDLGFDAIRRGLGLPQQSRQSAFGDALLAAMMYVKLSTMPKPKRRLW